ncbi:hypothetical protein AB1Y20_001048 [Prymnesium parvum]|uniref:Protein xylosyltransferase n=1 Tax=Prymnesium parvum TaxID=97485 RepID=A0AB34K755_PRYPA
MREATASAQPSRAWRFVRPRTIVPLALLCCVIIVLFQSHLVTTIQHDEFAQMREHTMHTLHQIKSVLVAPTCAEHLRTDGTAAPEKHSPSTAGKERLLQLLHKQYDSSQPTLKQLLAEALPHAASAAQSDREAQEVTVVLLFEGTGSLCRQLHALLSQDVIPLEVWVCVLRADEDGDKVVRELADEFDHHGRVQVLAVSSQPNRYKESGIDGLDLRLGFQLALQARHGSACGLPLAFPRTRIRTPPEPPPELKVCPWHQARSRYVLVLEPWVVPGARLLSTLVHLAQLPQASGLLGVAGWRALGDLPTELKEADGANAVGSKSSSHPGSSERGDALHDAGAEGMATSLALPDAEHGVLVPRLMQADLLRGAWFLRTDWLPLLFRDTGLLRPEAAEGFEVVISTLLRRNGDLPTYVLPTGDGGTHLFELSHLPPVTPMDKAAWLAKLWDSARQGDAPPPWRSAAIAQALGWPRRGCSCSSPSPPHSSLLRVSAFQARGSLEDSRKGSIIGHATGADTAANSGAKAAPRPVLLVLAIEREDAEELRPLVAALLKSGSYYEPRLVLPTGTLDCGEAAETVGFPAGACEHSLSVYQLHGCVRTTSCSASGTEPSDCAQLIDDPTACAELLTKLDELMAATHAVGIVAINREPESSRVIEAARFCASTWGVPLLLPAPEDVHALAFLATLNPYSLSQWERFHVEIAIITANRPASLGRLLQSLSHAHYLGDAVDVSVSIECGTSFQTLATVKGWEWRHGTKHVHTRVVKGGLISAVVESWYPSGEHSYGVLLEDDIEVSPYFYVYIKLLLLTYVYNKNNVDEVHGEVSSTSELASHAPSLANLIGISLYTPRLVEVRYPRRRLDLYAQKDMRATLAPIFLQQLPCSWGSLFFPQPWIEFHQYMQRRLRKGSTPVNIPDSAVNGWSESWKKFLMELMHLRGYVFLYPNFYNQTSFSTNHLEVGEHIGSKGSKLKHRPIDFTVPLLHDRSMLRELWSDISGSSLRPLPQLHDLVVLNHFSELSSLDELDSQGLAALSQYAFATPVSTDDQESAHLRSAKGPKSLMSTTRSFFSGWV